MQTILEDEVRHVSFGKHWLTKLKEETVPNGTSGWKTCPLNDPETGQGFYLP